jgi:hypothetical protein
MDEQICDGDEFWLKDPAILITTLELIPRQYMGKANYLNSISRLIILIAGVMWVVGDRRWWKILLVGLGITSAIWITSRPSGTDLWPRKDNCAHMDVSKYKQRLNKFAMDQTNQVAGEPEELQIKFISKYNKNIEERKATSRPEQQRVPIRSSSNSAYEYRFNSDTALTNEIYVQELTKALIKANLNPGSK